MERLSAEKLASVLTVGDFEVAAREYMEPAAYEYVSGGAGSDLTVADNRSAFNRIKILPRILVDVDHIDTRVELFGREHPFPILLAPCAYHKLVHPDGELETVRGANRSEATLVAACFSNYTYEELSAESTRPQWFQLYVQADRGFTRELVERVIAAGCEAICVAVDVPVNGPRDRELRAGFRLPSGVQRANLAALGKGLAAAAHRPAGRNIYSATHAANVTWKDVEWLRSLIPAKLLLKGILHPEDAELAVKSGCDGVIVSNHGGRSLDTVPAGVEALPAVVERVRDAIPVLMDSGVRRGVDIFKALALGAKAVLVGRGYLYGLAVGGGPGVDRVVEILRTELEMTMGLAGCTALKDISRKFLMS